jgi:hypothetical protein
MIEARDEGGGGEGARLREHVARCIRDPEDRDPGEVGGDPLRHRDDVGLQEEETPETVDDARHGGHEVDEGDEEAAQLAGDDLGDEQRGSERERHGDDHGDDGDGERAEQDGADAEHARLRRPLLLDEEGRSGHAERVTRAQRQEEPDREHDSHRRRPGREGDGREDGV